MQWFVDRAKRRKALGPLRRLLSKVIVLHEQEMIANRCPAGTVAAYAKRIKGMATNAEQALPRRKAERLLRLVEDYIQHDPTYMDPTALAHQRASVVYDYVLHLGG
jgi:hypothetical protein